MSGARVPKTPRMHDMPLRVLCAIMTHGPASATALTKIITGDTKHRDRVCEALVLLHVRHKIVRIHSWDSMGFAQYEAQERPGKMQDMPPTLLSRPDLTGTRGRAPKRYFVGGKLMTAHEIAAAEGVDVQMVYKRYRNKPGV